MWHVSRGHRVEDNGWPRLTIDNSASSVVLSGTDAGFFKGGGGNLGLHAKKGGGSSFEPNVKRPTGTPVL